MVSIWASRKARRGEASERVERGGQRKGASGEEVDMGREEGERKRVKVRR